MPDDRLIQFAKTNLQIEIVPVFGSFAEPRDKVRFLGTAFCWGHEPWFLTCRHVVSPNSSTDGAPARRLLVARRSTPDDQAPFQWHEVERNVFIDGMDVALLSIPEASQRSDVLVPGIERDLTLSGTDVWAFGFPLTREEPDVGRDRFRFQLERRFLKGCITRVFHNDKPDDCPTIELNFVLPPGISGCPVVKNGTNIVIGMAAGNHWTTEDCRDYGFGHAVPLWAVKKKLSKLRREDDVPEDLFG